MDIFTLPLEIIENIFLFLDTQDLATCALADHRFAEIIYSSHFLDGYCRFCFNCTLITAADVCNATVSMPFEFWFWVYTTMKFDHAANRGITFHSKYLTKIGTLKHMYIMWLMCGLRSSYMFSHALMYELYPLPFTVNDAFEMSGHRGAVVNDVLIKVFLALPGIMDLTCKNSLEHFSIQEGGNTSLQMDIVCNDGIRPKLPISFSPICSVEIIASPVFGKSSAFLLLITDDTWVMWIGYLNISQDTNNETTIEKTCLSKYFSNSDKIKDIKFHAQTAIQDVVNLVYSSRDDLSSPIISFSNPDINGITISLAQQHHSGLYKKFENSLKICSENVSHLIIDTVCHGIEENIQRVLGILDGNVCQNLQLNNYAASVLKIDTKNLRKLPSDQQIGSYLIRLVLDRIASLYRNEIHFCIENSFCHTFLCGCIGYACPVNGGGEGSVGDKIDRCHTEKTKDCMFNPKMWPSHILSAACSIAPTLVVVLQDDVHSIFSLGLKFAVSARKQARFQEYLRNSGLTLTQRPPTKPRCPPLLNQVRLLSMESLF